jgi:hypothetical protein
MAPSFDEDDRFAARVEPFDTQALIAEFAVKALVGAQSASRFSPRIRLLDCIQP